MPVPGSYFEIEYSFGGLGDDGLKVWRLDIVWNDSLVEIEDPTIGGDINFSNWEIGQVIASNHGPYSIGITAAQTFKPAKTGDVISLAKIRYHCLGPGQTIINPRPHFEDGDNFINGSNVIIPNSDVNFNSSTVNQVPIPSALLLLGTGLVGLVGLRRRAKK